MSKKTFRILGCFIIFTLVVAAITVGIGVKSYFDSKGQIKIADNLEDENNLNQESQSQDKESQDQSEDNLDEDKDNQDQSEDNLDQDEKNIDKTQDTNTVEDLDTEKLNIEIAFTGDVLFSDHTITAYNNSSSNIRSIISKELQDILINADITMINQEFPFSLRGEKMEDKQYTFRLDPKYAFLITQLGVDIVTLANNHILDFGIDALLDTLDTLKAAQVEYVGAGVDLEESKAVKSFNIKGKKIGFLGSSRVIPVTGWNATSQKPGVFTTYDPNALLKEIEYAKKEHDIIVVYVHWGIEREDTPKPYQVEMAKQYIDAGADIVVGSHPHVVQGIEFYKGKPIFYSLGNFIFGSSNFSSMIVTVESADNEEFIVHITPCKASGGATGEMNSSEKEQFYKYLEKISYDITIDPDGKVTPN